MKWQMPILLYCSDICLEGLVKITKNLSHKSGFTGIESNLSPPENKAGVLANQTQSLTHPPYMHVMWKTTHYE